jgi:AraC family transcriptional regulator
MRREARRTAAAHGIEFRLIDHGQLTPTYTPATAYHRVVVYRIGDHHLARAGLVRVIPADYWYTPSSGGPERAFYEIAVPVTALGSRTLKPRIAQRDPFLYAVAERMAGLSNRDDDAARLIRDELAEVIRLHLYDYYAVAIPLTTDGQSASPLTAHDRRAIVEYVDQNIKGVSVTRIAAHIGIHPTELRKNFPHWFATTPHQFLIRRRIRRARLLLSDTDDSITDISTAAGFSTPSHFATTFKQHVGVTPSAYRAALRQ